MRHYRDDGGRVYAFAADGSQDAWIPDHLTPIDDDEADALLHPLGDRRADRLAALTAACAAAITGGFASTALGDRHQYPSAETDQANLVQAATVGGTLWCANLTGAWSFVDHTADQARAVLADFVATRTLHQLRLSALTIAVSVAPTAVAVAAITWDAAPDAATDAPVPPPTAEDVAAIADTAAAAVAAAASLAALTDATAPASPTV